jgi:hypothetical protein
MTEQEVEVVAQALAEASGVTWQPERDLEPVLHIIYRRYRDRARLAIAAIERHRSKQSASEPVKSSAEHTGIDVGIEVFYRAPNDRRATRCTVEKVQDGRAYIIPFSQPPIGWVSLSDLQVATGTSDRTGQHELPGTAKA